MSPRNLIAAIILALGLCNIAFGMMAQVVPLAMDAEHDSKFLIGANVMAGQLGVLISGFSLTRLRKRFHSHSLVMFAIVLALISFVGFASTSPIWYWFAVRFVAGLSMSALFTTGESWLQTSAGDKARGRVMGSYMSSQTLTFAIGPFLIPFTGVSGAAPWLVSCGAVLLGLALMSRVQVEDQTKAQPAASIWATMANGKFLFLCIGMAALFESLGLSFFTLFAINNGIALAKATQILSFGIAAGILFFFPIGYLGDHWSRKGTIALCSVVAIVGCLLQGPLIGTLWIWPLIAVLRAGAFGVYLGGFGLLGDKFRGTQLVAASSIVSIMWGISGVIGPPLAGKAFDVYGLWLLPWLMAACYVPVLLALAAHPRQA